MSTSVAEELTLGQRAADVIARAGKSWPFLLGLNIFIILWMVSNNIMVHPWDAYPYILLNLFMSWLAANQAPVIMMSQGRQEEIQRQTMIATLVNTRGIQALLVKIAKVVETLPEELEDLDTVVRQLTDVNQRLEALEARLAPKRSN